MPRRSPASLADIADPANLMRAFWRAARGKRLRADVRSYERGLQVDLARLREEILTETVSVGRLRQFRIRDPKPRVISAPCFAERVLHHALMAHVGPVLDRALVDDSYACRPGRGALAAVQRVQGHLRRFPWFVQLDVRAFFASIDHDVLMGLLARRFRGPGLLRLMQRIVSSFAEASGCGLPIGSLTSQHFANYYLDGLDRFLLEGRRVCAYTRYMDDVMFWTRSRSAAKAHLAEAERWLAEKRRLRVKPSPRINRSACGTTFCGFRVLRGTIRLTARRRRRYAARRRAWEEAFAAGLIDDRTLQCGYAAVAGITAGADATGWRREQLRRHPEPCLEVDA